MHVSQADINYLLDLCDKKKIPIAGNPALAAFAKRNPGYVQTRRCKGVDCWVLSDKGRRAARELKKLQSSSPKRSKKRATKKRATKKRATKKRSTKKRATKKRATKKRSTKKRSTKKRATKKRSKSRELTPLAAAAALQSLVDRDYRPTFATSLRKLGMGEDVIAVYKADSLHPIQALSEGQQGVYLMRSRFGKEKTEAALEKNAPSLSEKKSRQKPLF